MDIKAIIAQSKQKKFLGEGDTAIRAFIDAKIQELVSKVITDITPEIVREAKKVLNQELTELRGKVFKGEEGKQGKQGKKGDSYILTNRDKDEIASKIDVPIVEKITEKIEVLKPVVTEKAIYEPAKKIAEKLNTLEEEVEIKVIKGLETRLRGLKESIRENSSRGGGMGNVVHEQFTGDNSTTQFTLLSEVAGNGNAVIGCRYEGQMQYLGDQFTISGRTLTMTFTPVLGTKIEITYIRA